MHEVYTAPLSDGPPTKSSSLSTEPNAFLTALATQERRVLELREDLLKAESDLGELKEQWAAYGAAKKRDEMRYPAQLRPIDSPRRSETFELDGHLFQSFKDQDCHRALYVKMGQSQRRFFSGSKHPRTLLLLDTTSSTCDKKYWQQHNIPSEKRKDRKVKASSNGPTTTNITKSFPRRIQSSTATQNTRGFPKEDLVNTGRQLVGDLREGLWTFIEDLRQATVGEEAVRSRHLYDGALGKSPSGQSSKRRVQLTPKKSSEPMANLFDMMRMSIDSSSYELSDSTPEDKRIDSEPVSPMHTQAPEINLANGNVNLKSDKIVLSDDGWDNWDSAPSKAALPVRSIHQSESLASLCLDTSS